MILRKLCVSGDMAIGRKNATFSLAFMHLNKNLGYFCLVVFRVGKTKRRGIEKGVLTRRNKRVTLMAIM